MAKELIGYARVSTTGQKLDVQLDALTAQGCTKIYQEKRSGKTADRPELEKMLDYVREGEAIVVTKLDRLGRSVADLANISKLLEDKGVGLIVLDQGIDTTTPHGKLMFHMIAAVAEFELSLRYERQMEGIAKAKEQGVKFGRKKTIDRERVHQLREEGLSLGKIAAEVGCSKAAVHKVLAEYIAQ
ncbi:recombinase family protein [Psychrosphaera haliotis]|uniref:recombinase family protein n=1 Tax=Psychrosphaera haliotis TaxID=555083 RepID=UPI0031D70CB9